MQINETEEMAAYNLEKGQRTAVAVQLGRASTSDHHLNAILRQHYEKGFNARGGNL